MALDELKISNILKELSRLAPSLQRDIKELIQHCRMLRSFEGLEPRDIRGIANNYRRAAIEHKQHIEYLTGEAERLAKNGSDTMKGHLARIRVLRMDMERQLRDLDQELNKLYRKADQGRPPLTHEMKLACLCWTWR